MSEKPKVPPLETEPGTSPERPDFSSPDLEGENSHRVTEAPSEEDLELTRQLPEAPLKQGPGQPQPLPETIAEHLRGDMSEVVAFIGKFAGRHSATALEAAELEKHRRTAATEQLKKSA